MSNSNNLKFNGNINTEIALRLDFNVPKCKVCGELLVAIAHDTGDGWFVDLECLEHDNESEEPNSFLVAMLWPYEANISYTKEELVKAGFFIIEG